MSDQATISIPDVNVRIKMRLLGELFNEYTETLSNGTEKVLPEHDGLIWKSEAAKKLHNDAEKKWLASEEKLCPKELHEFCVNATLILAQHSLDPDTYEGFCKAYNNIVDVQKLDLETV